MPTAPAASLPFERRVSSRGDLLVIVALASAQALLHILTNGRYGFHRDELQFLTDARHLDWGFVAFPPFTPFVEHIGLSLFGLSLVGLRLFSVFCQAVALIAVGLMTRELGGGRIAQVTAVLAVALSPLPLFNGTEFQYTSFSFLWWVLITYFTVRLLKSEDPRWWVAIGAVIGLGLQTKYAIAFFIAGLLGGMLFSEASRYFKSPWFWAGVAVALAIFLPNLLWLIHHDFISYRFLQHIHARDVRIGRAAGFLKDQFLICINPAAAPLALAGLLFFFREPRYRMLAWMYLIPLALFWIGKGRGYYVAEAYPVLIAMGAAGCARLLTYLPKPASRTIATAFYAALAFCGAYILAVIVPLAPSGPLRDFALKRNGDLREEFGWHQLVRTVAGIRDSLPADQQAHLGIMVGNYGEGGAIEMFGPAYHLPPPISMTNTAWLRGYPTPPPTTLILIGFDKDEADDLFTGCRLAAHNTNAEGIRNEESSDHPDIFLCGPLRQPWPQFWATHERWG